MTETYPRGRRATIRDIALRAGVSKGAVSYALNGRPGVSDETRERIVAIAEELGWYPNRAARALSAARADACGLVLARSSTTVAIEPFFMGFIAGVETELSRRSVALTIQLVSTPEAEIEVYRRWFGEHRIDGIFLVDLRRDDPRLDALVELGLPAVVIGGPIEDDRLPSVWHDEAQPIVEAVRYLAALGHRRIGRIAGVEIFVHTDKRTAAFLEACRESGVEAEVLATDYTPESGARATRRLLSRPQPPTAILCDSDLLAVTTLGVAQHMGFSVPEDLSIVGWDDSLISQVVHPPLSAITRDIESYGAIAARHLLGVIDGDAAGAIEVPRGELTARGSTGPAKPIRAARV